MKIPELSQLAEKLDEFSHLVVWEKSEGFEVVAIVRGDFQDAFPLPMNVQSAAAEVGMILDTTTAARLEIDGMPGDFWGELEDVDYGEYLKVSRLGLPGRKYLEIFHAVNFGSSFDRSSLVGFDFTEAELLNIARWLREKSLFDHRRGDLLMEVLTQLR
ncbi:MAG: hypothetical protein ABF381_05865 [Akkermansiaceae bacterium]